MSAFALAVRAHLPLRDPAARWALRIRTPASDTRTSPARWARHSPAIRGMWRSDTRCTPLSPHTRRNAIMATIKAFIASHPVVSYYVFAFAISWDSVVIVQDRAWNNRCRDLQ